MRERKNPFSPFQAMSQGEGSSLPVLESGRETGQRSSGGNGSFQDGSVDVKSFPPHLFLPASAQSVNLQNLFDVTAGTSQLIIDFTVPNGSFLYLLGYALFNDGLLASDFDFIPRVNGRRIYEFHGDPLDNFRLYLGLSTDFNNSAVVTAPMQIQPGDRLTWEAVNRSLVDTTMGVRVTGYIDRGQIRNQARFGG